MTQITKASSLLPDDESQRIVLAQRLKDLRDSDSTQHAREAASAMEHFVELIVGDDVRIAFAYSDMVEVLPYSGVVGIPNTPDFVLGTINFHGSLVTVLDGGALVKQRNGESAELVVISHGQTTAAIAVVRVVGSLEVTPDQVTRSSTPTLEYVEWVTREGVAVVDAAAVLSSRTLRVSSSTNGSIE